MLVVTQRRGSGPQESQKTCLWLLANTTPEGSWRPPRAAQLPEPPIAGLVHVGPGPALLALAYARGLASSLGCRGPAQGTLPRCRPQLHGSCSAEA